MQACGRGGSLRVAGQIGGDLLTVPSGWSTDTRPGEKKTAMSLIAEAPTCRWGYVGAVIGKQLIWAQE